MQTDEKIRTSCQQTQAKNYACSVTSRQDNYRETGCLKLSLDNMRQAFNNDICKHLGIINLISKDQKENCKDFIRCPKTFISQKHKKLFDENDEESQRPS